MAKPPKGNTITAKQRQWCRYVCAGASDIEAYKRANKCTQATAAKNAYRYRADEGIVRVLKDLERKTEDDTILTVKQRKQYLSRVVTTPLSEITADSDLCVEETHQRSCSGTDEDDERDTIKVKKSDPLRAITELNKMDGGYEPEKHEVEFIVNIGGDAE